MVILAVPAGLSRCMNFLLICLLPRQDSLLLGSAGSAGSRRSIFDCIAESNSTVWVVFRSTVPYHSYFNPRKLSVESCIGFKLQDGLTCNLSSGRNTGVRYRRSIVFFFPKSVGFRLQSSQCFFLWLSFVAGSTYLTSHSSQPVVAYHW